MINIRISGKMGERCMTQKELAEKTDIRPNTINLMYHNIIDRVSLEQLDRICEVLNCSISDILEYKPNRIKYAWKGKEDSEKEL